MHMNSRSTGARLHKNRIGACKAAGIRRLRDLFPTYIDGDEGVSNFYASVIYLAARRNADGTAIR